MGGKNDNNKAWYQHWLSILGGIILLCSTALGAFSWIYDTFATDEEVAVVDEKACQNIAQLSKKTIESFDEVNKTNRQMQRSIRRFDLKDSYDKLLQQKHMLIKLLENDPNNTELKIDLETCVSRIKMIEEELRALRLETD